MKNNHFLGTLLSFLGASMCRGDQSLDAAALMVVAHNNELVEFFRSNGIDGSDVTDTKLTEGLNSIGLNIKPLRSFRDMLVVEQQFNDGMVTEAEMLLALQCSSTQVRHLILYKSLPNTVISRVSITDWDEVETEPFVPKQGVQM